MKKILASTICMLMNVLNALAYEPSGRGFDPDAPDIGLPNGSEVGVGLLIAIVAIPIGYAILNACNLDKSDNGSPFGCLGVIVIGIGIVCLLPLFAWISAICSIIFGIGIAIMVIVGIIAIIFSSNK